MIFQILNDTGAFFKFPSIHFPSMHFPSAKDFQKDFANGTGKMSTRSSFSLRLTVPIELTSIRQNAVVWPLLLQPAPCSTAVLCS